MMNTMKKTLKLFYCFTNLAIICKFFLFNFRYFTLIKFNCKNEQTSTYRRQKSLVTHLFKPTSQISKMERVKCSFCHDIMSKMELE